MADRIDVESGNPYRDSSGHFGTSPDKALADSFKALQGKTFIPKADKSKDGKSKNRELIDSFALKANKKLAELRGEGKKDLLNVDEAKDFIKSVKKGDYTPEQQEAVKTYIGGDYKYMNEYMRHDKLPDVDDVSEVRKKASEDRRNKITNDSNVLTDMLNNSSLGEELDLYRAANVKGLKLGSVFTDKGFISTSVNTTAPSRMAKNGQLLRIKGTSDTKGMFPAQAVDVDDDELEFIIKPDTTFKVTNITEEDVTLDTGKTKKFKILEVTIQ